MIIRTVIADDSENFRLLIEKVLERIKEVELIGLASDGEEAVAMVDSLKPDLLLLDIRMPKMDGIKTLEAIRKDHPQMKVIMVTNYEMTEYHLATEEKGADGFVLKKNLFLRQYFFVIDVFVKP